MSQPLEKICMDLRAFQAKMNYLKISDPESYDKNLKIPAWRENPHVEDYSNALLLNVGKFIAHVDMLENANSIIDDVNINKSILTNISEQLVGQIKFYLKHQDYTKENKLGDELVSQLSHLGKILQNFSRSNNPNPPPSHSPG